MLCVVGCIVCGSRPAERKMVSSAYMKRMHMKSIVRQDKVCNCIYAYLFRDVDPLPSKNRSLFFFKKKCVIFLKNFILFFLHLFCI